MTMPPWSEDAELSRPYFHSLAGLARQYSLPELSMGMSNDFEVAIEEGATIVRVGTPYSERGLSPRLRNVRDKDTRVSQPYSQAGQVAHSASASGLRIRLEISAAISCHSIAG